MSLDDRLADLLPLSPEQVSAYRAITVRHLLQHSGGWDRDLDGDPFFSTADSLRADVAEDDFALRDCADVIDAPTDPELQFAAGSRYAYSNIGYCWLGRIIAARTALAYPLAVHDLLPEARGLSLSGQHADARGVIPPHLADLLVNQSELIGPAGGWMATAAGYYAFAATPVPVAVAERPHYAPHGPYYGLGWRVWPFSAGVVFSHYGAMPGYFSVVLHEPQGRVLVALFSGRPRQDEAAFHQWLRWFQPDQRIPGPPAARH